MSGGRKTTPAPTCGGRRCGEDEGRMRSLGTGWTVRSALLLTALVLLLTGCIPLVPGPQPPVPTWDTGIDSEAWAQIPAGTFHFGQHDEIVTIAAPYEMMVTDVTNAQYRALSQRGARQGRGQD